MQSYMQNITTVRYLLIYTGDQLSTGAQWNEFGRVVGHPTAAKKRRDRKLGCVVGASDNNATVVGSLT